MRSQYAHSPRPQFVAVLALAIALSAWLWDPPASERPIEVPDLHELIRVRNGADVEPLRAEVLAAIFEDATLPAALPTDVEAVQLQAFPGHQARALSIPLSSGEQQTAYFLKPTTGTEANTLAIYHSGHSQKVLTHGRATIEVLLAAGFHVLALEMTPDPHDRYELLERPLAPFVEPIAVGLNYAMSTREFDHIVMLGLSGGGWATVLYAAIDPRIERSYPVAGSFPFYLREQQPKSVGDFEQFLPGLDLGYLDLYLLASSAGRQQIQVFNLHDPCCFSGTLPLTYRDFIASQAAGLGGVFDLVIDDHPVHETSDRMLELIVSDALRESWPEG